MKQKRLRAKEYVILKSKYLADLTNEELLKMKDEMVTKAVNENREKGKFY